MPHQIVKPGETPLKVIDFSGGTWTKTPKEFIPNNATPYARNVLYDEKNRLTKIWGTEVLIAEAGNAFVKNPVYKLYNYITLDGAQILIIQGVDTTDSDMCLYALRKDDTTVTEIMNALALKRRCSFATHKGRLYVWNGADTLRYWTGSMAGVDEGWRYFHTDKPERFRYLAPHNYRLFAASSGKNPSRMIWTQVGGCNFTEYFATMPPDVNYHDFTTGDGSPIMHICEFQESLLIFKQNHIFRWFGDPTYTVNITTVSDGIGTIDGGSVKVFKNVVYFAWRDGVYVYGDTSIAANAEDRKLQTVPNIVRVSSEIDDYWATHFTLPDPDEVKEKTWAGSTDFGDFTLSNCQINTSAVTDSSDVINFTLVGSPASGESQTTTDDWVALRTPLGTTSNIYYSQSFKIDLDDEDYPITQKVKLYLKKTGTMASTHKLNIYITSNKAGNDIWVPDFNKVYAEAQVIGTSVTSATGEWIDATITYWKYPQNLYDGDPDANNESDRVFIAIKPEGDDSSNYISWGYNTAGEYADGRMVNYDLLVPDGQALFDYAFDWHGDTFKGVTGTTATMELTNSFDTGASSGIDRWGSINVSINENTFNDYTRRSELEKIEYKVSDTDPPPGNYIEIPNGGSMAGSGRYLKIKLTFTRGTSYFPHIDSFTLMSIKVTYMTQPITEQLISSEMWNHRYILSCEIDDSEGQETTGNCLDFDGNDNVWVDDADTLDVGTSDFAVEMWIKCTNTDQPATYAPFVGKWNSYYSDSGDPGWFAGINKSDGRFFYSLYDVAHHGPIGSAYNIGDGSEHYVVYNFDRSADVEAFLDKVSKATEDISALVSTDITSDLPLLLGSTSVNTDPYDPNVWYDGKLKQVRLYKRLLTTDDMTFNYANPTQVYNNTNLVGWWKCDEGQGDTVADSSGNDNDGERGNGETDEKPAWAEW